MENTPEKASIVQTILGFLFALGWMFVAGIFGFAFVFGCGMGGGSPNVNPTSIKLLVLFVFLGAVVITFAGLAGGAAIASAEQSVRKSYWKVFGTMIAGGLGLQAIGIMILYFFPNR